jgi:hypothetical protein
MNNRYDRNPNYFKKLSQKNLNKEEDLQKKYFYKLNLSAKKCNIFQLMENGLSNQDELEQVDNACSKHLTFQNELEKKQIECMKSMILHHKKIPERWIIQENYKDLLNKVMEDPIVLSYAIASKDIFKKRSTSIPIEELVPEKNLFTSPTEPRFISFINPYKKNYANSLANQKHKLMRDYCYNIKNKRKIQPNPKVLKNSKTINDEKNYYCNTEASQGNNLPFIFTNRKIAKEDKNENMMMTSLYFDENKINKDNKDIKDSKDISNKSEKGNEDDSKKKNIELPLIE